MNNLMLQARPSEIAVPPLPSEASPASLCRGLALLAQAYHYARQLDRNPWEFAVEHVALRECGLTNNDFRWLVCKGFVEHAREVTALTQDVREFRQCGGLVFSRRTCFVLTEAGVAFAEQCRGYQRARRERRQNVPPEGGAVQPVAEPPRAPEPRTPEWDSERREVRVGEYLVKRFKLPSANQEMILAAFQEDGWPPRIDDPLPQLPDLDPKRRLHDAIKGLNRHQKHRLLHFMGDGSGQGVQWEFVPLNGQH